MSDQAGKPEVFPQRNSPRLRDFDYRASYAYSVTICTRDRVPFFADHVVGQEVARCLEEQAEQSGQRLVAYCIMPDHIHILTGPSEKAGALPLPRFIQRFKSVATHRLWKLGISGVVWQARFFDHVLRKDEDLNPVVTYILYNPVRKGLVQAPERYPLSRCFLGDMPPRQPESSDRPAAHEVPPYARPGSLESET